MDSNIDKVRNYLPISVSPKINTMGFNKNILQPSLHRTGHSFNLSVPNISPPRLGLTTVLIPKHTKGTNRFSRTVMIYPNGCDPLSPAACPVLVISRLMRPEVTITFLTYRSNHTLNVALPDIRTYKFVMGLNETEGTNSTTFTWEST